MKNSKKEHARTFRLYFSCALSGLLANKANGNFDNDELAERARLLAESCLDADRKFLKESLPEIREDIEDDQKTEKFFRMLTELAGMSERYRENFYQSNSKEWRKTAEDWKRESFPKSPAEEANP